MTKLDRTNLKSNIPNSRDKYIHISGEQIKFIAEQTKCHEDYVLKVLRGKRETNTSTAKKIIRAASVLNTSIETAQGIVKEFILVGEND